MIRPICPMKLHAVWPDFTEFIARKSAFNPEFILGNIKIKICIFDPFSTQQLVQVVEILPLGRQGEGPDYSA